MGVIYVIDEIKKFKYKQCLVIRTDLNMSCGKKSVQLAHAAISSYIVANNDLKRLWYSEGEKKVALKVNSEKDIFDLEQKAKTMNIPYAIIRDFGLTEIEPNTVTAIGLGPDTEENLNKITSNLSLL